MRRRASSLLPSRTMPSVFVPPRSMPIRTSRSLEPRAWSPARSVPARRFPSRWSTDTLDLEDGFCGVDLPAVHLDRLKGGEHRVRRTTGHCATTEVRAHPDDAHPFVDAYHSIRDAREFGDRLVLHVLTTRRLERTA